MKILFILETQFHFLVLCKPIIMTTIFQYLTTIIQAAIVKITEVIFLDNTAGLKPVHLSLIICDQQDLMYQVFFFFFRSFFIALFRQIIFVGQKGNNIKVLCYREVCLVMPYKLTSFSFFHFRLLQNIFGVVQASAEVKGF